MLNHFWYWQQFVPLWKAQCRQLSQVPLELKSDAVLKVVPHFFVQSKFLEQFNPFLQSRPFQLRSQNGFRCRNQKLFSLKWHNRDK